MAHPLWRTTQDGARVSMNLMYRQRLRFRLLLVLGLLVGLSMPALTASAEENREPLAGREPTARYIVALAEGVSVDDVAASSVSRGGIVITQRYSAALNGFAAELTEAAANELRNDPRVIGIMPDVQFHASAQTTPTGVARVFATESNLADIDGIDERVNVDVAVVDSGVGPHTDLNIVGGIDCVASGSYNDANGHGTHVAGTIGALDNQVGVVGVAPGARIWSVKVLDQANNGTFATLLCGVDWVTANAGTIEVANMSITGALGILDDNNCGLTNSDPLHQAICASVAAGVTWVVAAGNDGIDAQDIIPAQYDEVITVSALDDSTDTLANFSNYGADIDAIAPGVDILSTYFAGSYQLSTGSSMAAPHAAGAAALYKATYPTATPAEVAAALKAAGATTWSGDKDNFKEPLIDVSTFDGEHHIDAQVLSVGAPASVRRGQSVTVSAEIGNNGNMPKVVPVSFQESPGGEILISAIQLEAGATGTVSFTWETDALTALGEHTFSVSTALLGDGNPDNDSGSATTTVLSGAATDAQVLSVSAPASAPRGQSMAVTAQVKNNSSASKTISVTFKEAPGGATQTKAITLATGATGTLSFIWATHASTALGTHTFTLTTSLPGDTTPGNNSGSATTKLLAGTTVDAQVVSVNAAASVSRGQRVTVSAVIRNNSSASKSIPVTFKEAPGRATQTRSITLAAGATGTASFTWTTNATTALGTHTFTVTTALSGDTVPGNNTGTATTTVTSGRGR